jgi:NADH-quinone oxidoreductase subunit E
MVTQEVSRILQRYGNDPADIIAILQDVQHTYRYLPKDVMAILAARLDIPLSRIYHLATFFRAFSLDPRGKHELQVCMGTACHVRGSPRILEALERGLKIRAGQTTPDLQYTLETVNCVGACALGPVVVVDGQSKGKLNPQRAERLLKEIEPGAEPRKAAEKAAPGEAKKKTEAPGKKRKAPARKAASTGKKTSGAGTKKTGKAASSRAAPSPKKARAKGRARKQPAKKARR